MDAAMKIGTQVTTPDGSGTIELIETFRTCTRYGVRLEKNPYSFEVAFYFEGEIKPAE